MQVSTLQWSSGASMDVRAGSLIRQLARLVLPRVDAVPGYHIGLRHQYSCISATISVVHDSQ